MMDLFETCHVINDLMTAGEDKPARDMLIRLLAQIDEEGAQYPQYLNELIRSTGLFPYMRMGDATWDQKYVYDAFAVDVGRKRVTLHREQSLVLRKLLDGTSLAVSAPTSFGKSFIIDAFIAANQPDTVVIIVPTIALMDETRRRIFRKFSSDYKIITGSQETLEKRNILIFPQERAFGYISKLNSIDLLVVDEFYKASAKHDKDRSPALIKAILRLSRKSKQRYYLAPNIKSLGENVFTEGMEFVELLDFNTVFLEKNDFSTEINGDIEKKRDHLLRIIEPRNAKTLIYAGTYSEVERVSKILIKALEPVERSLTLHFARWLRQNYRSDWQLADLAERGIGVHNGQMHRCLTQIAVRIFESPKGFDSIISTSSIIEGVNTSAENIVLWRNRLGGRKLEDFTYKNIIGRGGRMFKHFIGKIFLLEPPPIEEDTQLEIHLPDNILGGLSDTWSDIALSGRQIEKIQSYTAEMNVMLGPLNHKRLIDDDLIADPDADFILELTRSMHEKPEEWKGFGYLNSDNPDHWDRILYKIIRLKPSEWDSPFSVVVSVTKIISKSWATELSDIIQRLDDIGIDIEKFFKIERTITFKLASLVNDVNEIHKRVIDPNVDVSKFVARLNNAFLPKAVYSLEEYGLPRMISQKIHRAGLINFTEEQCDLTFAIAKFRRIGLPDMLRVPELTAFDRYVVKFFYHGISIEDGEG